MGLPLLLLGVVLAARGVKVVSRQWKKPVRRDNDDDRNNADIIPGLPDDVALHIVERTVSSLASSDGSVRTVRHLVRVNHSWREVIESMPEYKEERRAADIALQAKNEEARLRREQALRRFKKTGEEWMTRAALLSVPIMVNLGIMSMLRAAGRRSARKTARRQRVDMRDPSICTTYAGDGYIMALCVRPSIPQNVRFHSFRV